ncbi:MAG: hypothetical protein P8M25_10910 [Paracoccaceae bacterium]|nr:hypothetical protein [Paracoccaceae bacterium]
MPGDHIRRKSGIRHRQVLHYHLLAQEGSSTKGQTLMAKLQLRLVKL